MLTIWSSFIWFFYVVSVFSCNHYFWHFSALEVGSISFQKDCLQKYRTLFLEELEASITADYLFQYEILDIHTHDEIEQLIPRLKSAQCILHHLENKSNQCFYIFMQVLKISGQMHIFSEIEKSEQLLMSGGKCCFVLVFLKIWPIFKMFLPIHIKELSLKKMSLINGCKLKIMFILFELFTTAFV